jgi:hypothetical protein
MKFKPISTLTDEEIFIELLDSPFTTDSEKRYIDGVANWFTSHNKITSDQRDALKVIVIRARRRIKKSNAPGSWLAFLPVENFRPKKNICPKCKAKLVNWVGRIYGNRYKHLLVCENTLKHKLMTNPETETEYYESLCGYTMEVN